MHVSRVVSYGNVSEEETHGPHILLLLVLLADNN